MPATGSQTLRVCLRRATDTAHTTLDRTLADFDLTQPRDYARFLAIQLSARAPVETWCDRYAPAELSPPKQAQLLRADIADLEQVRADGLSGTGAVLEAGLEPLAVAWVIAGSSLGNRAMLAGLRKSGASSLPVRFLSDPEMTRFWNSLKPLVERPSSQFDTVSMAASAHAIFALFQARADAWPEAALV